MSAPRKRRPAALPAISVPAGILPAVQGERRPAHRPSTYDPAYCDKLTTHMATGASITAFAGAIGVSRATITNWVKAYPDFAEAVAIGKAKALAWWEERMRKVADGGGGPGAATVCMFAARNLAPDDWQDRQTHEHVGRVGHFVMSREEALEEAMRRGLPTTVYEE